MVSSMSAVCDGVLYECSVMVSSMSVVLWCLLSVV